MSVRESQSQIWEASVCQAGEGENCCAIEKWNGKIYTTVLESQFLDGLMGVARLM